MSRRLKGYMWATDIGFIVYWLITASHLIPAEYLYQDYENELLVAWNWSFVPLDLAISATGLWSLSLYRRRNPAWPALAALSLALTSCSGLQAISFWAIRGDFDPLWWGPNLFLLIYPLFFLSGLIRVQREWIRTSERGQAQ